MCGNVVRAKRAEQYCGDICE